MSTICTSRSTFAHRTRSLLAAALIVATAACGSDTATTPGTPGFLGGTGDNHEIGVVMNSTGKSMTLFQLGDPTVQQQITLGTSSTVTPTGFSLKGRYAAVPLGNAASVALIDLQNSDIERYFTFTSGNATGSVFADDTTIIAANTALGTVGRMTIGQADDAITQTVVVAAQPTAVAFAGGRALIVSANLDANFTPIGNGVITALDPKTLQVLGTVETGGVNSGSAAVGPDGLLYVVNTGDYVAQGSITIINPATMQVVSTVGGMGVGPGAISIDANGLAYISGFYSGTLVWNTKTRTFVRGTDNPVCAKLSDGSCRGAFAATTDAAGDVYQAFFGSAAQDLPPYLFVFKANSFALSDSISVGVGPSALAIRTF
jgi:hypothetical protein